MPDILDKPTVKQSMFFEWFELNRVDERARSVTYVEILRDYWWKKDEHKSCRRKTKAIKIVNGEVYNSFQLCM